MVGTMHQRVGQPCLCWSEEGGWSLTTKGSTNRVHLPHPARHRGYVTEATWATALHGDRRETRLPPDAVGAGASCMHCHVYRSGSFQWKVMPMGRNNGNVSIQRRWEDILKPVADCADPFVEGGGYDR